MLAVAVMESLLLLLSLMLAESEVLLNPLLLLHQTVSSNPCEMEIRQGTIEISENGEQKISFGAQLDQWTFEELQKNISKLEKFRIHSELHSIFIINFLGLSNYFQDTVHELTKKQVVTLRDHTSDFRLIKRRNSNRLLLNLLSSGRTFVDHQETYLKKEYGGESDEAALIFIKESTRLFLGK